MHHFRTHEEDCFRIFRSIQITNDDAERTSEQYEALQAEFDAQFERETKANAAAAAKIDKFKTRLENIKNKNAETVGNLNSLKSTFLQISAVLKSIFNGLGCDTMHKRHDKGGAPKGMLDRMGSIARDRRGSTKTATMKDFLGKTIDCLYITNHDENSVTKK